MITVRLRREYVYESGMRVVDAIYHHRLDLWAQCHNTFLYSYIDPEDERWVIIEFLEDKFATLFVLTYNSELGLELCI